VQFKLVCKERNPNYEVYVKATKYFLKKLLKDVDTSHVKTIEIKVEANMTDSGECYPRRLKSNELKVTIRVRKGMNFIMTLSTLAHECVHAAQYISGKLKVSRNGIWYWGTNGFGTNPYEGLDWRTVEKLPWEREAYAMETDLTKEYIDYYLESYS
jgi:hypothetical protein